MDPQGQISLLFRNAKGRECEESVRPPESDHSGSMSRQHLEGTIWDVVDYHDVLWFAADVICRSEAGVDTLR